MMGRSQKTQEVKISQQQIDEPGGLNHKNDVLLVQITGPLKLQLTNIKIGQDRLDCLRIWAVDRRRSMSTVFESREMKHKIDAS